MKNNAEAKNQIFNGIFRTPFSFLTGGPFGIFVNSIYTIYKVNHENSAEVVRKEYINSKLKEHKSLKEYKEEKKESNKIKEDAERANIKYLSEQFYRSKDISNSGVTLSYMTKDVLLNANKTYNVIMQNGLDIKKGRYYPLEMFIEMYNKSVANGTINNQYTLYNNNFRGTFCYESSDIDVDFIVTGMFVTV